MNKVVLSFRGSSRIRAVLAFALALCALPMSTTISRGQAGAITKVAVVQSLGNQSDRYVAGKDTAVLVFLGQPTAVDPAQQQVEVKLAGTSVAVLQPAPSNAPVNPLVFVCPSRSACGDWKAGDYTFTATVSGATSEAAASLKERSGLKILAVPVKANYGPGDVRSVSGTWRTAGEFVRAVYPLAPERLEITFGPEVDASADKYNVKTDNGQAEMFGEVVKLQPNDCFRKPRPDNVTGCYDKVVAFVKDRMGAEGSLQGFTMGFGTNIAVESDEDAPATVAHEIGHNYDLGDEYQGGQYNCEVNPPPPDFAGINFNNNEEKNYSCQRSTAGQFEQAGASIIKAETDMPFEVGGRGQLPDMASFMGSGAPQNRNWITGAAWNRIFDGLAPQPGQATPVPNETPTSREVATPISGEATPVIEEATPAVGEATSVPVSEATTRWIYVQGYIAQDGTVAMQPWYSYLSSEAEAQEGATGEYMIQALDGENKTLAATPIEVDFTVPDAPQLDEVLFAAVMPFPQGTTRFQIVKGDQTLQDVPVSANAPVVRIISPAAGEALQGDVWTVKWEASDADNDKLLYDLEYSADGEEWETIDSELEATESEVDLTGLAGSATPAARFRVTATDGVNATDAVSELFSVTPKAPEVIIQSPEPDATFAAGEAVSLEGLGFDAQDEDITSDSQLVWSSDVQGELGRGTFLNLTDLRPGKHTITLTATNSGNISGTGTVVVNIAQSAQGQDTPVAATATAGGEAEQTATTAPASEATKPPGAAPTATAAAAGGAQSSARTDSGSPVLWIVLGAAAIAILLAGGLLLMRRRSTPPPR